MRLLLAALIIAAVCAGALMVWQILFGDERP
jgi:hypothetical protein